MCRSKEVATTPAADVEIAAARVCAASQRFDRPSTSPHISSAVVLFLTCPGQYQRNFSAHEGRGSLRASYVLSTAADRLAPARLA